MRQLNLTTFKSEKELKKDNNDDELSIKEQENTEIIL